LPGVIVTILGFFGVIAVYLLTYYDSQLSAWEKKREELVKENAKRAKNPSKLEEKSEIFESNENERFTHKKLFDIGKHKQHIHNVVIVGFYVFIVSLLFSLGSFDLSLVRQYWLIRVSFLLLLIGIFVIFWLILQSRKAQSEQDVADAQNNLGVCYAKGEGVKQDYKKAIELFKKAAEQDDADAQNNLGDCYYYGWGVKQDYKKAFEWYKKAAEQGNANAQYNLGVR
jgi:TPR repeat protein